MGIKAETAARSNPTKENITRQQQLAVDCYKKAAALGHVKAKTNLAYFYVKGEGGVNRNKDTAISLLTDASNAGHDRAKHNLAILLREKKEEQKNVVRHPQYTTHRTSPAEAINNSRFKALLEQIKNITIEETHRASGEFKGEQYRIHGDFSEIKTKLTNQNIKCAPANKGDDAFLIIMKDDIAKLDKNTLDKLISSLQAKQETSAQEHVTTRKLT